MANWRLAERLEGETEAESYTAMRQSVTQAQGAAARNFL
jgi:hypothetical protein